MTYEIEDLDERSGDLLSPLTETEYLQLLLRDLHDDLPGRITRLRYLGDQARSLGPSGTMIFGGSPAYNALAEARSSFVNGNYAATVILCQALAENLLGGVLGAEDAEIPNRIAFSDTLRRCEEKGYLNRYESKELTRLCGLRNPLSHYRSLKDPSHVDRRSMSEKMHFQEVLEKDAFFAVALIMRLLAKSPFRVG